MPGGQDESVAVSPIGIGRIVLQEFAVQNCCGIGHAKWQTNMS
eukprot:CAMPEP_0195271262 /NCGR_PEP_ID=MMETSP0706-20130129/14938_1 /TAXON_ID=33640 /ORGANISM="Asterionellopsis glacialis, Strain CCMP134" /LENGTH=42 /DNA_ID= /DNA_START= /DNA_END= /DNA_ORIENTATION=